MIKDKSKAISIAKIKKAYLKLWYNRSKLDKKSTRIIVIRKIMSIRNSNNKKFVWA